MRTYSNDSPNNAEHPPTIQYFKNLYIVTISLTPLFLLPQVHKLLTVKVANVIRIMAITALAIYHTLRKSVRTNNRTPYNNPLQMPINANLLNFLNIFQICFHHNTHQFLESYFGIPPNKFLCFSYIGLEYVYFSRSVIPRVYFYIFIPI